MEFFIWSKCYKYKLSLGIIFLIQGPTDCYPVHCAQSSAACVSVSVCSSPVQPSPAEPSPAEPSPAQSSPASTAQRTFLHFCGQDFSPVDNSTVLWTRFQPSTFKFVPSYMDAICVLSVPFPSKPGRFLMADTSCATVTVTVILLCYKCYSCSYIVVLPWVSQHSSRVCVFLRDLCFL